MNTMLVQANKTESELVEGRVDKLAYGGLDSLHSKPIGKQISEESFNSLDRYIRSRAITKLKSTNSKNSRALFEIGDLHFKNKAFARAAEAYIKGLKINPNSVPIHEKLIQSLVAQKRFGDADKFFNNLITLVEKHPKYISDYASFKIMLCLTDSNYIHETKELIDSLKTIDNDAVQNVRGLFELVVRDDAVAAKEVFELALTINGDNVDANNNVAICYRMAGDFNRAEQYFQKAHYIDLKYLAAYENLASVYYQQGQLDKAIKILENAVENQVKLTSNWQHNFAMFYFQNREYEAAISLYKVLMKEEPSNSLVVNNIGVSYEKLQKFKTAQRYFINAVSIVKSNKANNVPFDDRAGIAFTNLIRTYNDDLKFDLALKLIKSAKKIFPNNNVLYHQEAVVALNQSKFSEAKELFKKSIELNPGYLESYVNYSYILEDIDFDYPGAIELLEGLESLSNKQIYWIIYNNLAYAYLKTGQTKKARTYLLDEDKSYASFATKGLYFLLTGNGKKSQEMYKQAFKYAQGRTLAKTKQFYNFEHMEYWIEKGDEAKALNFAKQCLEFPVNKHIAKAASTYIKNTA